MSEKLLAPDFRRILGDFERRLAALERRITTAGRQLTEPSGLGGFVALNHLQSVPSSGIPGDFGFSGYTTVEFDGGDALYSEGDQDFWWITDNEIFYKAGIYAVVSAVTFDPPTGSTGKNITWDTQGLPHYQTLTSDMAGVISTITFGTQAEITAVHADGERAFFGGWQFRIAHNLGATVSVGAAIFITKIGTL